MIGRSGQFRQCRHDIRKVADELALAARFDLAGPADEHWRADAPFVEIRLGTFEWPVAVEEIDEHISPQSRLRAVVRREKDDRVIGQAELFNLIDHFPDEL